MLSSSVADNKPVHNLCIIHYTEAVHSDVKEYFNTDGGDTPMSGAGETDKEKCFEFFFSPYRPSAEDNKDIQEPSAPFRVLAICLPPTYLKIGHLSQTNFLEDALDHQYYISCANPTADRKTNIFFHHSDTDPELICNGIYSGDSVSDAWYKNLWTHLFDTKLNHVPNTFTEFETKPASVEKPFSVALDLYFRGSTASPGEGPSTLAPAKARVTSHLKNIALWAVHSTVLAKHITTLEDKKALGTDIEKRCTNSIKSVRYLMKGGGKTNVIIPGSTVDMVITFNKLSALMFAWEHASKTNAEGDHPMPIPNRQACFNGGTAIPFVDHAPRPRRSQDSAKSNNNGSLVF